MIREADFYAELGRNVLQLRQTRRLTQEQLANIVGLTRTSITNIEKGRQKVLAHLLLQLALALNVNVNELLPRHNAAAIAVEALPAVAREWFESTMNPKEKA